METIKKIIENINNLEQEFDIFNSRIIEFSESTKKWDIDTQLLKKYIKTLEDYKELSLNYKLELDKNISEKSNEDFQAQKELVIFRLEKLEKLFDNNLNKLKIILESFNIKEKIKDNLDVDFKSTKEMLEINENLYNFYNNYNSNLDFQKNYNINIFLNNEFEKKIEKRLNSYDLVKEENEYLSKLNFIFESIESLDLEFKESFKKLTSYKNNSFDNFERFENYYFPEKLDNFIIETFKKELKKSYEMKDFEVEKSMMYNDFDLWAKIINKEFKDLNFLINFNNFGNNYKILQDINKIYNIFTNLKVFDEIYEIFYEINNKRFSNFSQVTDYINSKYNDKNSYINNWVKSIEQVIDLFENTFKFINKYDYIYKDKANDLNYSVLENLFSTILFHETVWENYIRLWLKNIKENINKEIRSSKDDINLKNDIITKYNIKLENTEKEILKINSIVSKIKYGSSISLAKTSALWLINKLNNNLLFLEESKEKNNLINYINNTIEKKYEIAKQEHYRRTYHSWSSFSSHSSSFSSGSSSFSSSFSSSWSSRW